MKHLFDRLAALRPPSELGWVGTVSAVFVIVAVVMILVYLAMAAANADVEGKPESELPVICVKLAADDGSQIKICGRFVSFPKSISVQGCNAGARI